MKIQDPLVARKNVDLQYLIDKSTNLKSSELKRPLSCRQQSSEDDQVTTAKSYKCSEPQRFLTTKEACKHLKCSRSTLFSYRSQGLIKSWSRKKEGLLRWCTSELDGFN